MMSADTQAIHSPAQTQLTAQQAVLVEGVHKRYGTHRVLEDLSFSIDTGEIFALLGPNGAGKTTTVEILEGYRTADQGRVRVLGLDPQTQANQLKPRIGVMLQQDGLYPALTVLEVLELFSGYFQTPQPYGPLLERLGLTAVQKKRCRYLSGGQKRRLALALALLGNPEILFLDEPTAGMDPQAARVAMDMLREQKAHGTTILLTTHILQEAEQLADRIAILDHGQIIALETPQKLLGAQATSIHVATQQAPGADFFRNIAGIQSVQEIRPHEYNLEVAHPEAVPQTLVQITKHLQEQGINLTQLRVGHGSLEELFLRLTGSEVRD